MACRRQGKGGVAKPKREKNTKIIFHPKAQRRREKNAKILFHTGLSAQSDRQVCEKQNKPLCALASLREKQKNTLCENPAGQNEVKKTELGSLIPKGYIFPHKKTPTIKILE
jgi:hypothetical protein